jgi:hypothetical protein
MKEDVTVPNPSQPGDARRTYESPVVVSYGTLTERTRGGPPTVDADGSFGADQPVTS